MVRLRVKRCHYRSSIGQCIALDCLEQQGGLVSEGPVQRGFGDVHGLCDPLYVNSFISMLPKHLNGTVECFVRDKPFWTPWGALRNISYHRVRNSLHRIFEYRTLAYVTLQDR